MKKDIQNIHDKIIKDTFSRLDVAKEYFKEFLPASLKDLIDFDSIKRVETSYLSEDWTEYFADLLFQFKLRDSDLDLKISILFEHKSLPEKNTLIQVGNYIFHQWSKELKDKKSLAPIIPLVYYQGNQEWEIPRIKELFPDYPEELLGYLPEFDFIQLSITSLSKDRLSAITNALLYIVISGHDRRVNPIALINKVIGLLAFQRLENIDWNLILTLFVYKLHNSNITKEEIMLKLKELPESLQRDFVSTYDQIVNEGRIEGRVEGKVEMILAMYDDGFSLSEIVKISNLSEGDVLSIFKKNDRELK